MFERRVRLAVRDAERHSMTAPHYYKKYQFCMTRLKREFPDFKLSEINLEIEKEIQRLKLM